MHYENHDEDDSGLVALLESQSNLARLNKYSSLMLGLAVLSLEGLGLFMALTVPLPSEFEILRWFAGVLLAGTTGAILYCQCCRENPTIQISHDRIEPMSFGESMLFYRQLRHHGIDVDALLNRVDSHEEQGPDNGSQPFAMLQHSS